MRHALGKVQTLSCGLPGPIHLTRNAGRLAQGQARMAASQRRHARSAPKSAGFTGPSTRKLRRKLTASPAGQVEKEAL